MEVHVIESPGISVSGRSIGDSQSVTYNFGLDYILAFLIPVAVCLEEAFPQIQFLLHSFANPPDCQVFKIPYLIDLSYCFA